MTQSQPGLFAHSKAHGRWIAIHKTSTRNGKFGKSRSDDPEAQKTLAKIPVAWDFTAYHDKPHIVLPLRTSGSTVFPDRIEYEARSQRYKLRFFSKLKTESAETALYIQRADLLAAFGEDPSARVDDAVVPADPPKTSSLDSIRMNAMAHAAAIKRLAYSPEVRAVGRFARHRRPRRWQESTGLWRAKRLVTRQVRPCRSSQCQ